MGVVARVTARKGPMSSVAFLSDFSPFCCLVSRGSLFMTSPKTETAILGPVQRQFRVEQSPKTPPFSHRFAVLFMIDSHRIAAPAQVYVRHQRHRQRRGAESAAKRDT
uniref:Uncharacterized protein n=1 Tax=Nelumbo nucifera TaxID=4432 RepID=A0A822XEC4_NELNU|nr:TPA_asm: hypothetical protein HUJ06_019705 [Nelumbo nucifera]